MNTTPPPALAKYVQPTITRRKLRELRIELSAPDGIANPDISLIIDLASAGFPVPDYLRFGRAHGETFESFHQLLFDSTLPALDADEWTMRDEPSQNARIYEWWRKAERCTPKKTSP